MDKNYIFLKHKTIMTRSFISQNLAGGGVKIYRLITEPVTLTLKDNTQKLWLPMELKSTDSLLMTYTINNVSGFTCYTTQTNTVILPLQYDNLIDSGKVVIPMFNGTTKRVIGMYYYRDSFDERMFVYRQASKESNNIPFIIEELYLLR